jgi:hypothetical protein
VIVPIVEGDGEVQAVPLLLRRLLEERRAWDARVARPRNAGGITKLARDARQVERFLRYAVKEPGASAILVLVDADADCPLQRALLFAMCAEGTGLRLPVAVVVAKCEYEAWFLASAETLAGRPLKSKGQHDRSGIVAGTVFEGDPEGVRNAKGMLSDMMPANCAYKETLDQAPLTEAMDLALVRARCRSFRRVDSAVAFLVEQIRAGGRAVSPSTEALRQRLWQ